jgi:hypothetical protein
MKKQLQFIFFFTLFIFSRSIAQVPDWVWAKSGSGGGHDVVTAVATDASGNVYATGSFTDSIVFGSFTLTNIDTSRSDIFVVKYNSSGNLIWAKSGGGTGKDSATAITTDDFGNVYITGHTNNAQQGINFGGVFVDDPGFFYGNCIVIVKYDSSGNSIWVKVIGGSGDGWGTGITSDSVGDIYISGYANDDLYNELGMQVVFDALFGAGIAIKYDSSGNYIWTREGIYGGNKANAIDYDRNGFVYVTGTYAYTSDFDSLTITNTGGPGTWDIFLVKYDLAGTIQWIKNAGGADDEVGNGVAADALGNAYLTGSFTSASFAYGSTVLTNSGGSDIVVAKYNSSGAVQWAKSAGGNLNETGKSIDGDLGGNMYITGHFYSSPISFGSAIINSNGMSDIVIAKYSFSGNELWAKNTGSINSETGNGIAVTSWGDIYVGGYFESPTVIFNSTIVSNTGLEDAYVGKLTFTENIEENYTRLFTLYPNPAHNTFTISFNEELKMQKAELKIYDVMGRVVYEQTLNTKYQTLNTNFSPGIYFVKATVVEKMNTMKLIIE